MTSESVRFSENFSGENHTNVINFSDYARSRQGNSAFGDNLAREEKSYFPISNTYIDIVDNTPYTARGVLKATTSEPILSYYDLLKVMDKIRYPGTYQAKRDFAIFVTGVSTGLRVSDICLLKTADIFCITYTDETRNTAVLTYRNAIDIFEKKTGKRTVSNVDEMLITESIIQAVNLYMTSKGGSLTREGNILIPSYELGTYLFGKRHNTSSPMDESGIYRNIVKAIREAGVDISAGTHTMRKTFLCIANAIGSQSGVVGANSNALADCQILARHSSELTTLKYMNGVKTRITSLRRAVSDFVLGRTKIKTLASEYVWDLDDED